MLISTTVIILIMLLGVMLSGIIIYPYNHSNQVIPRDSHTKTKYFAFICLRYVNLGWGARENGEKVIPRQACPESPSTQLRIRRAREERGWKGRRKKGCGALQRLSLNFANDPDYFRAFALSSFIKSAFTQKKSYFLPKKRYLASGVINGLLSFCFELILSPTL